ncbi:MAG: hypothetical protein JNM56_01505 [Planctomycetia bacterium]|nr:hypothetical protein [Planctomycetia bacterium]
MRDEVHSGAVPVTIPAAPDLRQRLLREPGKRELRIKYLATRTAAWAEADLRFAGERLLLARAGRGLLGLALVGAAGGAIGDWLFATSGSSAWPVVVGVGSALTAALSFAVLGALGCVVLPEVVGEEWESRHGTGFAGWFSRVQEPLCDALLGGVWGALCGLFIGVLSWPGGRLLGTVDPILAGASGGVLLGAVFAVVLAMRGKRDGLNARHWACLGPLPVHVYWFSLRHAHRLYLHKRPRLAD